MFIATFKCTSKTVSEASEVVKAWKHRNQVNLTHWVDMPHAAGSLVPGISARLLLDRVIVSEDWVFTRSELNDGSQFAIEVPTDAFWICPKCGGHDRLDVTVMANARLVQQEDGFETDCDHAVQGDHDWGDTSRMQCTGCDYADTSMAFEAETILRNAGTKVLD